MGTLVDGRAVAAGVMEGLAVRVQRLHDRGCVPQLAFVLIGESGPARVYAGRLERLATTVGIDVSRLQLPADVTVSGLERQVGALNADWAVDGILVQMPLPPHLVGAHLSSVIDPHKDVDGITVSNAGKLYLGLPGHPPSTARAILEIIDFAGIEIAGQHAIVIGRSNVVGHPVAELLLNRHATVTITHRRTRDLFCLCRQADVLVVAAGAPGLITPDALKSGVVIVDAGINVTEHGVVGDVDPRCVEVASVMTPVPGGVGPVTNAVLLVGVVESAETRDA
jgi:methylenetetrahydrofolate dehydrogenase (NADP+) / methenyltetrahydrofolate cyclohydrolase